MIADNTVLTMLRAGASADAPPLTLQVDDVLRSARRRRLRNRALVAGAGVLASAAVVTAVVAVGGSDPTSRGPTDHVTQEPTAVGLHMMPAILKDAALSDLDPLPNWTWFGLEASNSQHDALPEPRWDEATSWSLAGTTQDGALSLALESDLGPGETPGLDVEVESCDVAIAVFGDGLLECRASTLPDGRILVSTWDDAAWNDPAVPTGWDGHLPRADEGMGWYVQSVEVYEAGSGFLVNAQQAVQASSLDDAKQAVWLTPDELLAMAVDPSLRLSAMMASSDD